MTTLDHLSREAMGPAEMARLLEVSTAASTGIVDRLVDRGHAERQPHPEDRRRVEVHLTDSGRTEILEHLGPMFRGLAALDASFTDAELVVVERYLRGAVAALEAVIHPDARAPLQVDQGPVLVRGRTAASACARLKTSWASCSQVIAMPPCSCTVSAATLLSASEQ